MALQKFFKNGFIRFNSILALTKNAMCRIHATNRISAIYRISFFGWEMIKEEMESVISVVSISGYRTIPNLWEHLALWGADKGEIQNE